MGRSRRPTPKLLAQKLLTIRKYLRVTQEQMIERLDYKETPLLPGHISEYERGRREPPLEVLLRYARLVRVPMEVLVDDKLMLPAKMRIDERLSRELYEVTREQYVKEMFKKGTKRLKRKEGQDE
jgi:transcriptional regulator with XRE-family HTH domain